MTVTLSDIEVEEGLREQAEYNLNEIGLSYPDAINLFTQHIAVNPELPFSFEELLEIERTNATEYSVPFIDNMTQEELTAYMQKAYDDLKAGRCYSIDEAERILKEEHAKFLR